MLGNMNGWHLVMVLAVVLLLFGAAKLPALAKSVGQSARILKGEMKADVVDQTHVADSSRVSGSETTAEVSPTSDVSQT